MEGLKIKSNKVRLAINDDENRVIEINPADISEKKRIQEMSTRFEKYIKLNQKKLKEISDDDYDSALKLSEELFDKLALELNEVFGKDTAKKVTDGEKDIEMLTQFCLGITPYYEKYNKSANAKYNPKMNKTAKKGVMK